MTCAHCMRHPCIIYASCISCASSMCQLCVILAPALRHLCIIYVSSMYHLCIICAPSIEHPFIIYASSMNLLCEIYVPSVYHHIPSGNRLGGIWEVSGRHLEPSGSIWKHFEVPGGEEGDSGGFEIDFCLKIVLFLAKNHENL